MVERREGRSIRKIISRVVVAGAIAGAANLGGLPPRDKEEAVDLSCYCCGAPVLLGAAAVILKKSGLIRITDKVPPFYK